MERRRQRNRNRRLMLALMMLIMSAVAVSTATYAWFSANTVVTTEDIDVKVTASAGISISANAVDFDKTISMSQVVAFGKDVTDGKVLTADGKSTATPTLVLPEELSPVSTVGLNSGSWKFYKGQLGDNDSVVSLSKADASTNWKDDNFTYGDYVAFDVYIRSSIEQDIKLSGNSSINVYKNDATNYDDAYMQTALRIGFQNLGTYDSTKNQQANCYALNSASTTDWVIWNPYPSNHHASSLTAAYGTDQSEYANGYYAALGDTSSAGAFNNLGVEDSNGTFVKYLFKDVEAEKTADASAAPYFQLMNTTNTHYIQTGTDGLTPSTKLFHLGAGITKVRVYIWLEGQDIDCVDAISISDGLTIDLGFEVLASASGE